MKGHDRTLLNTFYYRVLLNLCFLLQILLEGRPGSGFGNSVAIFEIHIVPGYCIGQSVTTSYQARCFNLDVQSEVKLYLKL